MKQQSKTALKGARISHLFIFVQDFATMLSFYRDTLGFEVYYLEQGRCAFLKLGTDGSPAIALYAGRESIEVQKNHWFVAIDVTDLDESVQALTDRGVKVGDIKTIPSGRYAQFSDPENNLLEIHQPSQVSS